MDSAGTRNNVLYCKCLTNDVVTKCTGKNSTISYFKEYRSLISMPNMTSSLLDSCKINLTNFWTLYSKNKRYFWKMCEKYNLHISLQLDECRCCRSLTASLCEPLLHAALEEREVWVPVNVLHSRTNAHGHVPSSVQRLQPKRVVPVELSGWKKRKNASIGRSFTSLITFDLFFLMKSALMFATYILIPHVYDFFTAVIETKVAA